MICHTQTYHCPTSTPPPTMGPAVYVQHCCLHLLVSPREVVLYGGWGPHHEGLQGVLHQWVDTDNNEDSYRHGTHRVCQHPAWGGGVAGCMLCRAAPGGWLCV